MLDVASSPLKYRLRVQLAKEGETDRMQSRYKDETPEEADGRSTGQRVRPRVRLAQI